MFTLGYIFVGLKIVILNFVLKSARILNVSIEEISHTRFMFITKNLKKHF